MHHDVSPDFDLNTSLGAAAAAPYNGTKLGIPGILSAFGKCGTDLNVLSGIRVNKGKSIVPKVRRIPPLVNPDLN
jgi:hypothetical protein